MNVRNVGIKIYNTKPHISLKINVGQDKIASIMEGQMYIMVMVLFHINLIHVKLNALIAKSHINIISIGMENYRFVNVQLIVQTQVNITLTMMIQWNVICAMNIAGITVMHQIRMIIAISVLKNLSILIVVKVGVHLHRTFLLQIIKT